MISIICVYNNEKILNDVLLKSLKHQTVSYELITINNIDNKFKSAASAYNTNAKKVIGKYILFVHQDIELDSNSWLEETERILNNIPNLGIAGVAGAKEGKIYGYLNSEGHLWGSPFSTPIEVQTIDGCLIIIPNSVFKKQQFDEIVFDGWHCYSDDYALSIKKTRLNTYVIPSFVYHRTLSTNNKSLVKYLRRLYVRHKSIHKHIYIAGDGTEISIPKMFFMYMSPIYNTILPKTIRNKISPTINKIKKYVWNMTDIV